nr:piggyBac transposable element-derived protein 3-like [Hydra vulgaris]
MSNKKLFTSEEAARYIIEEIPSEFSKDIESSDSENEFRSDALKLLKPIENESESSNDSESSMEDISIDRENYNVDEDRKWTKKTKNQIETPFSSFKGPVKDHFADCQNPIDYFFSYFDNEIKQNIIHQTNLYITQNMKATNYCICESDLTVPCASSALPRNRFAQILSNIHVNDNAAEPNDNKDKLYKLRPLINQLNSNFVKLYNVSQCISIDESMILFKGRSSLKQYNPMKPIKKGVKLWAIADMDGYMYHCEVYQGKNKIHSDDLMPKHFGLGASVVYQLTKTLHAKHHQVYFDNIFTTVLLMEYLLQHKVY